MKKNFRTIKVSLIMGILLFSLVAALMPSASAKLINFEQNIDFEYEIPDQYERVTPLEGFSIDILVRYQLSGLLFQDAIINLLNGPYQAQVTIKVGQTDPWVTAVVTPSPTVYGDFTKTFSELGKRQLYVKFTEDAPAGATVKIPITLEAKGFQLPFIGVNKKTESGFEIAFDTKFLPIVDAQVKRKFIEVSPGDIASFEIELINLGNAETEFVFPEVEAPKGWIVSYPSKVLVDSRLDGGEKTVSIEVTPPYEFGWHDDTEKVTISYKGRYFAPSGDEIESAEYDLVLIVRNRGFSISAFEGGIVIIVIVILLLILFLFKKIRLPGIKKK